MQNKHLKTVLIIDDEACVRVTVARMLERAGFRAIQAANGIEGLKAFERERVDLVICDIIMPEQEGIETIGAIRCRNRSVKIVAMSGGARVGGGGFLDMAARLGADHTLAKPFDRGDLVSLLRSCLDGPAAAFPTVGATARSPLPGNMLPRATPPA